MERVCRLDFSCCCAHQCGLDLQASDPACCASRVSATSAHNGAPSVVSDRAPLSGSLSRSLAYVGEGTGRGEGGAGGTEGGGGLRAEAGHTSGSAQGSGSAGMQGAQGRHGMRTGALLAANSPSTGTMAEVGWLMKQVVIRLANLG